jgi:hypothetical protein
VSQNRGDLKQRQKHLNAFCVETGKRYDMTILNAALRRKVQTLFLGENKVKF